MTSEAATTSPEQMLGRLLEQRHSVRSFLPRPLDSEVVEHLLTLAGRTPSWSNVQPWSVDVVSGQRLAP